MLNKKQKEAVEYIEGPLAIFAGPGTGKTTTLQKKFQHLISKVNVNPKNILGLTFTRNTANELKNRISKTTKVSPEELHIHTFHSFGLRVVQVNAEKADLQSGFTVIDSEKQDQYIHNIFDQIQMPWNTNYIANIRNTLSKAKREQEWEQPNDFGITEWITRITKELYPYYQTTLRVNNQIDFDDIIIKVNKILRTNPYILENYKEQYQYMLLDEAQDTDNTQKDMINLLKPYNITIVGDPNQSIYKFRGTNPEFMRNFIESFDAKEITLEENYRNPQIIIDATSQLISKNPTVFNSNLVSKSETNLEKIQVLVTHDELDEAERITNLIEQKRLEDTAILYRTNAQANVFEGIFQSKGIPYQNISGMSFYERKEILDSLALLTLLCYDDKNAFSRVCSTQRGLGKRTAEKIIEYAKTLNITCLEASKIKVTRMTEEQHQTLKRISTLYKDTEKLEPYRKAEMIITTLLPTQNTKDKQVRVNTLIQSLKHSNLSIEQFLQKTQINPNNNKIIKLSTLHGAKGKEFEHVFIAGTEEGLLPYSISEIEEERRLLYVGMTRAKQTLTLTLVKNRSQDLIRTQQIASQFLQEFNYKEYL